MALYNERGNIRVTEAAGYGLYAADGALRVTTVDGSSLTGFYAADGSLNVVVVSENDTPVSLLHPCGALRVVSATSEYGNRASNGALFLDGLSGGSGPSGDAYLLENGTDYYLLEDGVSFYLME